MKGLDTPVLLDLLRGRKTSARLLKDLHGEELATTELNLYELEIIARSGPRRSLERRLTGLDGLRRKLTVLPVDEKGSRAAANRQGSGAGSFSESLMLGVAEAAGCTEWITTKAARLDKTHGKPRVRIL